MHTYMLKELEQSQTLEQKPPQIIPIRWELSKNCAPFSNCKSEVNSTQLHDANDIDVVMPLYNLIYHGNIYLKTS